MSITDIKEKSGLSMEVAESLYWHSMWIRSAAPTENINWSKMLKDKNYRCMKKDSLSKH